MAKTNVQPWLLVLLVGLLITTSVLLAVFTYEHNMAAAAERQVMKRNAISSDEASTNGLIFTTIIHRHGDRTPLRPYANDPWQLPQHWPVGWGKLTAIGRRQQTELGSWLRHRYLGTSVLPQSGRYDARRVQVVSCSDAGNLTLESAEANAAGMFPGDEGVDVTLVDVHDEATLNGTCDAYRRWRHIVWQQFEQPLLQQHRNLTEYLERYAGEPMRQLHNVRQLYDTLLVERLYGRRLPMWAKRVFPGDEFATLAGQQLKVATAAVSNELGRLRFGSLLKEILGRMEAKSSGRLEPADKSMVVYSATDETIVGLLGMLGVDDVDLPPYCAALLIEMQHLNGEPLVQVFYRNGSGSSTNRASRKNRNKQHALRPLNLPGCGTLCPLGVMLEMYASRMPEISTDVDCDILLPPSVGSLASSGVFVKINSILFLSMIFYLTKSTVFFTRT